MLPSEVAILMVLCEVMKIYIFFLFDMIILDYSTFILRDSVFPSGNNFLQCNT